MSTTESPHRDALDATLPALLPQVRLTLTQINLTPEAAPALRRLGMDLVAHAALLRGLYAGSEAALVRRGVERAELGHAQRLAAEVAEETLGWVRRCRVGLKDDPARALLGLEVPRFAGALRCLEAAAPAVAAGPLQELGGEGMALLARARGVAASLEAHGAAHAAASQEVDRLRVEVRSALRALRRAWRRAPELPALNLSHAARSVQ
jgi:hypothetical protein